MLRTRLLTLAFLAPVVSKLLRSDRSGADRLAAAAAVVGGLETARVGGRSRPLATVALSSAAFGLGVRCREGGRSRKAIITAMSGLFAIESIRSKWCDYLIAAAYSFSLGSGVRIRSTAGGREAIHKLMVMGWMCDAANSLLGPLMPGPRLPEALNSNKSWLGYTPGVVAAILMSVAGVTNKRLMHVEVSSALRLSRVS